MCGAVFSVCNEENLAFEESIGFNSHLVKIIPAFLDVLQFQTELSQIHSVKISRKKRWQYPVKPGFCDGPIKPGISLLAKANIARHCAGSEAMLATFRHLFLTSSPVIASGC